MRVLRVFESISIDVIIPVALGGGRTVFKGGRRLRLVQQRAFACGNVVVTYAS